MDTTTTYTINEYTATWDDAVASRGGGLEAGDRYRCPINETPDGRELDAFRRRYQEAGLVPEYSDSDETWDYYTLIPADYDEDEDDDMDGDAASALESVYGPND